MTVRLTRIWWATWCEVLTSFCARLYGRRSVRNRVLKAVGCARRDIGPAVVVGGRVDDAGDE